MELSFPVLNTTRALNTLQLLLTVVAIKLKRNNILLNLERRAERGHDASIVSGFHRSPM